jgi:hypothetical protein
MKKRNRLDKAPGVTRRRDWKPDFLAALASTGNVKLAAAAARVSRQTAYSHRDLGKAFAQAWDEAMQDAADVLEAEARRRAVEGTDEPVIYEGKLQGTWVDAQGRPVAENTPGATLIPLTVKKYSDVLLIFLMKGANPKKYRETHHHVHAGDIGFRTVAEGATEADSLLGELRDRFGTDPGSASTN